MYRNVTLVKYLQSNAVQVQVLRQMMSRNERKTSNASNVQMFGTNKMKSDSAAAECSQPRVVIFDMGGVLISSPAHFFKEFEQTHHLPNRLILETIMANNEAGAWARLERGELTTSEFIAPFQAECSASAGSAVDLSSFWQTIYAKYQQVGLYSDMVEALRRLRAKGLKTALLTNNWLEERGKSSLPMTALNPLFDAIIESCVVRMRKPDPAIFHHTLTTLGVKPTEVVFLDDLGMNVKAAKALGMKTIKVKSSQQAIGELEQLVGFPLQSPVHGTTDVPSRLQLPVDRLHSYLQDKLNLYANAAPILRYFAYGQSNPTYFLQYAGEKMVLRKKPPGKLLPSAHAVEREFQVMSALYQQQVPVPKMLALCEDNKVIGSAFYLMEYLPGRVYVQPHLPGMSPSQRALIYDALLDAMVSIHKVNLQDAGLTQFGPTGGYMQRNFSRWAKQYRASETIRLEAMEKLMEWLPQNMPSDEKCTLVHGDYRLDNLLFHQDKPQVLAILDWELSTLGDPLADLATTCMMYYLPSDIPDIPMVCGFGSHDITGIPSMSEFVDRYAQKMGLSEAPQLDFYIVFCFFRLAAILQGVYKRSLQGQASSSNAQQAGKVAELFAQIGWDVASRSTVDVHGKASDIGVRSYSTLASQKSLETPTEGCLPLSVSALPSRVQAIHQEVSSLIRDKIIPLEPQLMAWHTDPETKWQVHPAVEHLKELARSRGLWNLFLPLETDPQKKYGAALTNVEYAFICEEMGKSLIAPEVFNCSAPDTGNMEILVRYGSAEQKERWLQPLLSGEIRSCFAMTEPDVASSDATNIQTSIAHEGNEFVISGHKWWTSGALDPRCRLCIVMGRTDPAAPRHQQQSMVLVPMDSPGLTVRRALTVLGYEDAPHGHAEIIFDNVRVPDTNILLGKGRGFEIAQGRLGPGRIHHCMRLIGMSERALDLAVSRTSDRVSFGKPLATQSSIQQRIADCRISIEQSRLLVLKTAHMMDTVGNKVAAAEIAMIKVAVPSMAQKVLDTTIQMFGAKGMSQDTPIAWFFAWSRALRIADGPDEVHQRAIAKMEYAKTQQSKL